MSPVSATAQFHALVAGGAAAPLDVGCLLIAAHAHDDSDSSEVLAGGLAALDDLAGSCPGPSLDDLRRHLFSELGFRGNRRHYDDPRNSYLDHVLATRSGIPITLSVVMIEVGRRLGITLEGVGMPGHFLVGAGDGWYVDAFDAGRVLDTAGCRERFLELAGPGAPWSDELLAPVSSQAVLARVLANLRRLFAAAQDLRGLDWVLELRLGIPGVPVRERAERASVLAALGRYDEAAAELEALARSHAADDQSPGSDHPSGGGSGPGRGLSYRAGSAGDDDRTRPGAGDDTASALLARAARLRARLN
ncbi:MAG: hypothetical protein NVSMB12_11300 [Acidimicrobiales bacterium]